MKFFSDKCLFRIIFDKSLILLFVPIWKIMFVGERLHKVDVKIGIFIIFVMTGIISFIIA